MVWLPFFCKNINFRAFFPFGCPGPPKTIGFRAMKALAFGLLPGFGGQLAARAVRLYDYGDIQLLL